MDGFRRFPGLGSIAGWSGPVKGKAGRMSAPTSASEKEQMDSFSRSLKAAIERSPLSQKELAERLGISKNTINSWCNGRTGVTLSMALHISNALGMTIDEVFCHDPKYEVSPRSLERRKNALTEAYSRAGLLLAAYGSLTPDGRARVDGAVAVEIAQMQTQR